MKIMYSGPEQIGRLARPAAIGRLLTPDYLRVLLMHFLAMGSTAIYFFLPRFVRLGGGDEFLIGLIMMAPPAAAVLLRLPTGQWIDRFGKKRLILYGLAVFSMASALPVFASRAGIYLMFVRALAGASGVIYFTASVTYVADKAPARRRAEAIAVYGAAGFVAQALVPYLAEWLLAVLPMEMPDRFHFLFGVAALFGLFACLVSFGLSGDIARQEGSPAPDHWSRVLRNRTMAYLIVPSLAFGAGYASIFNFITDFSQVKGIGSPSWFFVTYSVAIILLRLSTGRMLDRIDRRMGVLLSLSALALGLIYASFSHNPLDLLVVGLLTGIGHCYIFPTLSSLTYDSSQVHNRGTSMALYMLGFDLGAMLTSPVFGWIAESWDYYLMYRISAFLIITGLAFYVTGWRYHAPRAVARSARGRGLVRPREVRTTDLR